MATKKGAPKKAVAPKKAAAAEKAAAPKKAAASTTVAPTDRVALHIAQVLRPFGFPLPPGPGLGFTPGDDALLARGWPHLRVVTDGPVKNAVKVAEKALDAIDPVLRLHVPRALAEPYIRGYRVGPLLFVDSNHSPANAELRVARLAAMRRDSPIDRALLDATLRASIESMGRDTYGRWRLPEVMHLYEHFIGTDEVARALADVLVLLATDLELWGFAGEDPGRTNAPGHGLAFALPWILRRTTPSLAAEIRARIGAVTPKRAGKIDPRPYFDLLHAIVHPDAPLPLTIGLLDTSLALVHDQPAPLAAALAREPRYVSFDTARLVWLLGGAPLAGPLALHGLLPVPLVDALSTLRDPGVVRFMAHLASQRAGAKAAGEWLTAHSDHARPILEALHGSGDAKEAKHAAAALDLLGGKPPAKAPASEDELEAEIGRVFDRLGEQLRATRDREAQMAHIRDAHEAYTEARSAVGDPTPEAYFTHRFGDFGLGEWAMLAVDAL